jgi:tetratricopeptide (TPR) repeat protein
MRVIFLPTDPEVWLVVLAILVLGIGVALYKSIWPSASQKVLQDGRYHQALTVYVESLPEEEEPTRDDRRAALAAATLYLVNEHGIPSAEAAPNMQRMVAAYDREQSYELRHEGIACEEAGDYESALAFYERAARLQEDHDPADHRFLLGCADRVRGKVRPGRDSPS